MTFVADSPAQRAPAHGAEASDRDRRIAVGGMWVCMLDALSDIGVWFATFLAHQVAPAHVDPKGGPKGPIIALPFVGDPVDAFVRVARAVRLAVMLMMRIEDEIAALKAGKRLEPGALLGPAPPPRAAPHRDTEARDIDAGDAGREAAEAPERPERPERESLEEREDPEFYRLLNGPLKDAVAAICADLGLKPDWSLWTEDGFPPPPGGGADDWIAFFVPEADLAPTPPRDEREPAPPPPRPRYDGNAGGPTWRPPWPPPDRRDPSPLAFPAATWPPDRAARPGDPVGRTRKAILLGTTALARVFEAAELATARPD